MGFVEAYYLFIWNQRNQNKKIICFNKFQKVLFNLYNVMMFLNRFEWIDHFWRAWAPFHLQFKVISKPTFLSTCKTGRKPLFWSTKAKTIYTLPKFLAGSTKSVKTLYKYFWFTYLLTYLLAVSGRAGKSYSIPVCSKHWHSWTWV